MIVVQKLVNFYILIMKYLLIIIIDAVKNILCCISSLDLNEDNLCIVYMEASKGESSTDNIGTTRKRESDSGDELPEDKRPRTAENIANPEENIPDPEDAPQANSEASTYPDRTSSSLERSQIEYERTNQLEDMYRDGQFSYPDYVRYVESGESLQSVENKVIADYKKEAINKLVNYKPTSPPTEDISHVEGNVSPLNESEQSGNEWGPFHTERFKDESSSDNTSKGKGPYLGDGNSSPERGNNNPSLGDGNGGPSLFRDNSKLASDCEFQDSSFEAYGYLDPKKFEIPGFNFSEVDFKISDLYFNETNLEIYFHLLSSKIFLFLGLFILRWGLMSVINYNKNRK